MANNLKSNKFLTRDGTSQQDRDHEPLQPDYVQVEDRSMEALIVEAQRLAKELRFFDEQNRIAAEGWTLFLIDDAVKYQKSGPEGRKIQERQWAGQLAAFVENPDYFLDDEQTLSRLSRPHSVLFMVFLKLLGHVKSQINGLTQKHLDFYFRERLGLTPKGAVPDVVNVLLELVEDIDRLEVTKDTILFAGEDAEGNELHYKTDEDTIISQARIEQLKTVFADKKKLTIKDVHLENEDTPDRGLTAMMEMALGDPNPGNRLPPLPTGVADLPALNARVQQDDADAIAYVTEKLFLSKEDFSLIMQNHQDEMDGKTVDWQKAYDLLSQAFVDKFKKKRQQALKQQHEEDGFESMLEHVYGSPLPGNSLPLYRGNLASFAVIHNDLLSANADSSLKALDYILEELKLNEQDFDHIVKTSSNPSATEEDLEKMYRILELAERQVRSIALPSPVLEKLSDVYAEPDVRATAFSQYGDEDESTRFKTFGSRQPEVEQALEPANLGFAVSSPALLLKEGSRKITALVDLGAGSKEAAIIQSLFSQNSFTPLHIYLSSAEQWFRPEDLSFAFGHYLGMENEGTYSGSLNGQMLTITSGDGFDPLDVGKYLAFPDGTIYEVITIHSENEAELKEIGGTTDIKHPESILKFAPQQVYLNALKVVIDLSEDDLPIIPFGSGGESQFIRSQHPAMVFSLYHTLEDQQGDNSHLSRYQDLMHLKLKKVHLSVDVKGMQEINLQNDRSNLDAKKPFEPFGFDPEVGSNFYFANEEIAVKKLHRLELNVQWAKQPQSFQDYYDSYWKIDADEPELLSSSDAYLIKSDSDFKARGFFHDKHAEVPIEDIPLFQSDNKIAIDDLPSLMKQTTPGYRYRQNPEVDAEVEDVVEWERYFRLELDPIDFQHTVHNSLFARQATSSNTEIKALKINPPYQPKLKRLKVGYLAYTDIFPGEASHDSLYHIHPFGFEQLEDEAPGLLSSYDLQGTLHLGISQLETPQILSILFQLAAGSADPEVEKPTLLWSYLRNNKWVDLDNSAIISDTTNGLVNTGILRIRIPADATTGGTLMPDTLHWLKVSAAENIAGISDTVDIMAQAVSATLSSPVVAPSHFENPLAPESIKEPLEPIPEIDAITQPFTSLRGKPAEKDNALYKRLSERLRHKNRALTMWDYEHMVLNEFPQVYKAKCFPSETPGKVDIVVIPDIRRSLPFNPFSPKVAADTLFQIREYLNQHSPEYAEIDVFNPTYLQVKARCTVKFHPGHDESFYKAKLINEMKRFLSPWAFDAENDIRIGGSLDASVLINFIAERPYVDYAAHMKLFQSEDGKKFTDVRTLNDGKTIVMPSLPDRVMVSAQSHEIDIVDENDYSEDSFEGLNFMKVELDFIVAEDLGQTL